MLICPLLFHQLFGQVFSSVKSVFVVVSQRYLLLAKKKKKKKKKKSTGSDFMQYIYFYQRCQTAVFFLLCVTFTDAYVKSGSSCFVTGLCVKTIISHPCVLHVFV